MFVNHNGSVEYSGFSSMDVDTSGDIMYGGFPIDFYYDLNLFYFW